MKEVKRLRAAMIGIRDDAHPLALRACEQRGCKPRCGCSDCEVLDDIETALCMAGWLKSSETRAYREWPMPDLLYDFDVPTARSSSERGG